MLALTSENEPASDAARQGGEMMHPLGLLCCSSALPHPLPANDMIVGPKNKNAAWQR